MPDLQQALIPSDMLGEVRAFLPRSWVLVLCCGLLFAFGADANQGPVVDDISASRLQVPPGGTVDLVVDAHDPDCAGTCDSGCGLVVKASRTAWRVNGGRMLEEDDGVNGSPYVATAVWEAPAALGIYTLEVFLRDNGSFWCGRAKRGQGSIDIEVVDSPNAPPEIASLTASPVSLFEGDSSVLTCEASDPDGDALTYSWETDSGTLVPGADGTATLSTDRPGLVSVTCTVTDPFGGFDAEEVRLSVTGAIAERQLREGLVAPQRLAVDSDEVVHVVDRAAGGLTALHLASGELAWRLNAPEATSVAVDWNDHLLLGETDRARLIDRHGTTLLELVSDEAPGDVVDVAVDELNRRYGVLHRTAGRILVFDATGDLLLAFGGTGDADAELRSPRGLAASPDGHWVVADTGHGMVKTFDADGTFLSSFGSLGGGLGSFVQLDAVVVDERGVVYISDSYQDWVQSFDPDGTLRETIGTFGVGLGRFRTAAGLALLEGKDRLAGVSVNTSSVQVFVTSSDPVGVSKQPVAAVMPSSLSFPDQAVQTAGAPMLVTLENRGDAPLGLLRSRVRGNFEQAGSCGDFIDVDGYCDLPLVFRPRGPGLRSGTLSIWTSDGGEPLVVQLSGFGYVPPGVQLSRHALDFPDQDLFTTSEPYSAELTNTGTVPLTIHSIRTSGDYALTHDCGSEVPGGDTCRIDVSFTPTRVADHILGVVTIETDAFGSPHEIELDGRGVNPLLDVADVSVAEGDEPPATEALFEVSLSNVHELVVEVDYATLAGTAVEGEDYEPVSGTLTFDPGTRVQTVPVTIVGDGVMEPYEESFTLELSNPRNAVIRDGVGEGLILDDEDCLGPNLLANGSAEDRWCEPGLPGWSEVAGAWQAGEPEPEAFEGRFGFAAASAGTAELRQDVAVAPYASRIDAGTQVFRFEAWTRGLAGAPPDGARVVVEYRDLDNRIVLATWDSGEISAGADWLLLEDERLAPAGTGWIRVRLLLREAGADSALAAWFDAVSLRSSRTPTFLVSDAEGYEGTDADGSLSFEVATACPWYREVTAAYASVDGTAAAGLDHLAVAGSIVVPVGESAAAISVVLLADAVDEGHESFTLQFEAPQPPEVVTLDLEGLGTIINDDACPKGLGYWKNRRELWPTDCLEVGGELLDGDALEALLSSRGGDPVLKLARHLTATLFNLELGSDPVIVPVTEEADAFLVEHPPGSTLTADERREATALKTLLEAYNEAGCRD